MAGWDGIWPLALQMVTNFQHLVTELLRTAPGPPKPKPLLDKDTGQALLLPTMHRLLSAVPRDKGWGG